MSGQYLAKVIAAIEDVTCNADSTGCGHNVTVTGYAAIERLEAMLPGLRDERRALMEQERKPSR